jgi:hypothetical protein
MALPKIDLPLFEMTIPSTGEKVKFRPFTVKEEKILLVAQESKDSYQEILAAKQIINNCLIDCDVSDFAMFDLEYVLLTLRSRSVDNTISFTIKDPETDEQIDLEIDIENISLQHDPSHSTKIKINDVYWLILKYPTIEEFISIANMDMEDPLVNYYIMCSCLKQIASEDELHDFSEYTRDEVDDFMESLAGESIKQIQTFFETMPKLRHEIKYNNKLGNEKTFVIEGTRSFFI